MSELSNRREALFSKMKENSAAVIFAGVAKICSEDETYPFLSNRNFFYLTNIEQENSILLLVKGIGEKRVYLFVDEYNELKEKWTGRRLTFEEARDISKIDNIYSTNSFENMLSLALSNHDNQYGNIDTLYLDLTPELKIKDAYSTENFKDFVNAEYDSINVVNIHPILSDLRLVKSSLEVENMVRAINLTNGGINQIILELKSGVMEKSLADTFEFYGRKHGCYKLAFPTIVASGKNATCLHYPQQKDIVRENHLVLFDLGYSYEGYSADISRTYPVNGKYEGVQKEIYEAVLICNKSVIEYVRTGMTIKDLQDYATEVLKRECIRRGLMDENDDIRKYYYHNVSHFLGLDTHDVGDRNKPLENGNVITVEPGLYFAKHNCGVRIEDDVLIRDGRGECLSKGIAKEIADIERIFQTKERY